jgi:hypothetical protein
MALVLFWLKIAFKRIAGLVKTSPAVTIAVWIAARSNAVILLENSRFAVIAGILFSAGLLTSLKKYDTIAVLMRYAKSGTVNSGILNIYFLQRALLNTIPLLFFDGLILCGTFKTAMTAYLPAITLLGILCSFYLLRVKHKYYLIRSKSKKRARINSRIKSILYDYCTPSFMLSTALSIGIIIAILGELIKNSNLLNEMRYPSLFFVYLLIPFGFGCMGVIDSVPNINWRFYAIVCPKDFRHHFNIAFFFLIALFGVFILAFFGILVSFDIRFLPKYLFTLVAILLFSINTAYSSGQMLVKIFCCLTLIGGTLWLGVFNAYLLPVVLLPLWYTFWKAKQDYKDWYRL